MSWPDTPLTTYLSNSLPAIKAFDLNEFQRIINQLYGGLLGVSFHVFDEDFEAALPVAGITSGNVGKFNLQTVSNVTAKAGNFGGPAAIDGVYGYVKLIATGTGATQADMFAESIGTGARDIVFRCRARVHDIATLNAAGLAIGLFSGAPFSGLLASSSDTHWQVKLNGSLVTSGVLIANDQFVTMELIRASGQIVAFLNGSQVGTSVADTTNYTLIGIQSQTSSVGVGVETYAIDYVKFGAVRS